jgi:molybdopterin synthase catalytic subunit
LETVVLKSPRVIAAGSDTESVVAVAQRPDDAARTATITNVETPAEGNNWFGLTTQELPIGAAYEWAVRPDCGAVVLFSGTIRNHAEGREGVQHLTYEAYEEQAVVRFKAIGDELRVRWPDVGRVVLLHRTGELQIGESSVIAIVSTPHRPSAFEAARFAIDALKETAPIWKHEVWADGADWGTGAHDIRDAQSVGGPE